MTAIICRNCGVSFFTHDHRRRYCGPQCRCQAQVGREQGSTLEVRQWEGHAIQRRRTDGYVNATAMCKATGREWFTYARAARTGEYIAALERVLGSPQNCGDLIEVITTGPNHLRGTWIHPRLAVDLARWCRPAFAVWMDGWLLGELGAIDPTPAAASEPTPRPSRQSVAVEPETGDELLFGRHDMASWNALHETERQARGLLYSIHQQQSKGADVVGNTDAIIKLAAGILAHYVKQVEWGT
ncbi:MAG: KilA-N domain-containing protein [Synechococcaceae cyanobacterium]|nr:KilA-N domain-containing protein [Synechococcaceae cyanobacterium]